MAGHSFKHFVTITKHRHQVIKNCFRAGIPMQGLKHDLSKYSPSEFLTSARHYVGTRSPNELEREKYGFSYAWMHHKGRNRHHFEYWTDYSPITKQMSPVKMPLRFVVEMFCDRVAASKIYKGQAYTDSAPYEYFMRGKARTLMHPETAELTKKLLTMLKDEGEEKTFAFIRKELMKKGEY
ncbi:MAG: catalase [Christensenellaceae bacterium]|nr:catalase [Christensenellaceae bacterium]